MKTVFELAVDLILLKGLKRIASEDYRGNRNPMSVEADKILKEWDKIVELI